jgi:hypothetical protein
MSNLPVPHEAKVFQVERWNLIEIAVLQAMKQGRPE